MARRLYDGGVSPTAQRRQVTVIGLLTAAGGAALFAWLVWRVGPREIWGGFRQIGWGLVWILILGGLRFAARAAAWTICLEPPHRLSFAEAFTAEVCGDALGNATPLGPLVSEAAKIACVRRHVPVGPAVTALAIENVLYSLSVAAMIAAGAIALLLSVELPPWLRSASEVAVACVVTLFMVAAWVLWRRPAIIDTLMPTGRASASRAGRLRAIEQEVFTFAARRRGVMFPLVALELGFHALGVAEKHLTLWLILPSPPSLLTSFIVETADRLITVAFKFVPYQVGFGEAGTALVTQVLGLGAAPGVTLSIVRKARMGIWSILGTAFLVRRGLTARRVLEDADLHSQG
jgi:hypothetical protein